MATPLSNSNQVRVWVDGCFDLFHYGHANAIRQSREMANWLVAGCHSDESIAENKGPPVITQSDRVKLLEGCRWVDQVVPDAPYTTELAFIAAHSIDFVAHGDDVTTDASGQDSYRLVKEAGLYRQFPRTAGVSTTDALARILDPETCPADAAADDAIHLPLLNAFLASAAPNPPPLHILSPSLPRASPTCPSPAPRGHSLALVRPLSRPIVYLHGTFDLFSAQDLLLLKQAAQDGAVDLLIGIWTGNDAREKLQKQCIWNFQERALGVLQCRHVTGLILPAISPNDLLPDLFPPSSSPISICKTDFCVDSSSSTIDKILARRAEFVDRQARKSGKAVIEKQLEGKGA